MALDVEAVLLLSRDLQRAVGVQDLLVAARAALRRSTPYQSTWLAEILPGTPRMVRILAMSGEESAEEHVLQRAPSFPVDGDTMLEEIVSAVRPVVVDDARTDPRTDKAMVARLGNRTIVNVPLLIGEDRLGALGIGTFDPEPPLPPTAEQLDLLTVFATQLAAAFQRVQMQQAQRALQRQLQASQRLESLAVLAGGVAHDFNNLLTAILNGLAFVGEAPLAPRQREDLDGAMATCRRAADLTRQLLALGRKQALHLAPVDLATQLRKLRQLLSRLIPETVQIAVEAPEHLPPVWGDETQLVQVLMNLCLNARDAMPDGGQLTIRAGMAPRAGVSLSAAVATHRRATGPQLFVAVDDTGKGMPPEVVEHVFEPFFTTKTQGQGTGLGLAVAAGIVEQHGGRLECTSRPGAGTTFRVFLPVWDGREAAAALERPAPSPGAGTERVLVAEDEPVVRQAILRVLQSAGYRVTAVGDGQSAVEQAEREPFDLVVLDAVMPRASGREAWERIRTERPATRFLVVSGHAAEVFPPEIRASAGLPFLAKPFLGEELLRAVRAALDAPPPGQGTAAGLAQC